MIVLTYNQSYGTLTPALITLQGNNLRASNNLEQKLLAILYKCVLNHPSNVNTHNQHTQSLSDTLCHVSVSSIEPLSHMWNDDLTTGPSMNQ